MLSIAIWLGTLGYAVFYYGERLWVGEAVTIAEALGFSTRGPDGTVRLGQNTIDYLKRYGLTSDRVNQLIDKAKREGKPPGYYLPGGAGWKGTP